MTHPTAAETARTLLAGYGTAHVVSAVTGASAPVLHAADHDAVPVLLLGVGHLSALAIPARDGGPTTGGQDHRDLNDPGHDDAAVVLRIHAEAPLPDLTLPRAVLEVAGWATRILPTESAAAVEVLAARMPVRDVMARWSRHALVGIEPAEVTLHWPGGCTPIPLVELRRAEPDPLAAHEGDVLQALTTELGTQLARAVRSGGPIPGCEGGSLHLADARDVRAVGIDRHGVTLRCTWDSEIPRLIRMPFADQVTTPGEAIATVRHTVITHLARPRCACWPPQQNREVLG